MTDRELQVALRALGRRLEGDEQRTDLAARVVERLPTAAPAAGRSPVRWMRPTLIAAALLLLGVATAVAASDTVRSWLHARGIDAKPVVTLPATAEIRTIADLEAGSPVTEAAAASALGRSLPRSATLGPPAAILLSKTRGPAVTLVWEPGPGLPAGPAAPGIGALLTIVPSREATAPPLFAKALGAQTLVEFVTVRNSGDAVWISGAPHAVTMFNRDVIHFRLAANVLVWSEGENVLRLETALDRDDALAAAESFAG